MVSEATLQEALIKAAELHAWPPHVKDQDALTKFYAVWMMALGTLDKHMYDDDFIQAWRETLLRCPRFPTPADFAGHYADVNKLEGQARREHNSTKGKLT